MSERLETGLRALAERAERTLVVDDGFAAEVRRRAARGRLARGLAGAGVLTVMVLAGGYTVSSLAATPAPAPPAQTGTGEPAPPGPSTAPSTSGLATVLTVDGWRTAGADPTVFAGAVVTDAVAWQGDVVAVGCDQAATAEGALDPVDAPIWVGSGADWRRSGPVTVPSPGGGSTPVTCLDQVVASPFGLYAGAGAVVLHSSDGLTWEVVDGLWPLGEGWADAVVAAGDRVTVLSRRASVAESQVASLWTTTDGTTWAQLGDPERYEAGVGDDPAVTFDDAGVAQIVAHDGTVVAVGASPGGEFVPSAAAWTSTDTVTWTPATVEDGAGCYLTAVTATPGGLVGAGWCSDTGQPAVWTATDGTSWLRAEAPVADLPDFSFVQVSAVSWVEPGVLALTGVLTVGGQEQAATEPSQWWSDGATWTQADDLALPYQQVDGTGFWPPVGSGPAAVLVPDR